MRRISKRRHGGRATLAVGAAVLLAAAGCNNGDDQVTTDGGTTGGEGTSAGPESTGDDASTDADTTTDADPTGTTGEPVECTPTREFFVDEVWPMMGTVCIQCHDPTGVAAEQFADFLLLPPIYPGFIDANIENIRAIKGYQYEGVPLLLAKPTGLTDHGGGDILPEGSAEYEAIVEFLEQLEAPLECPPPDANASFADVELLDAWETLRKAALHLQGRLPTEQEYGLLEFGGGDDEDLEYVVGTLLEGPAFEDRLLELFNDVLLTDQFFANNSTNRAASVLNNNQWPNRTPFTQNLLMQSTEERRRINKAIAREPLDLIRYIVRYDRPFTEILTAEYMVFRPDTAWFYDVDIAFDNPNDYDELQPGLLSTADMPDVPWPHAGILSSPMWLNRYPTTVTNRNRHRSRMIYQHFLATNVLELASQAIDPEAGSAIFNPTRNNPVCAKCHRGMDPLAGAFQMFSESDDERLLPEPVWHGEMFSPGFGTEEMPPTEFANGIQWLAQRVVEDPRFSLSIVYHVYKGLTGHDALKYPTDPGAPGFDGLVIAWENQDAFFRKVASDFELSNYNLKTILTAIVMSPYFRARDMPSAPSDARAAELTDVGTARLSTPELLARKIYATAGVRWDKSVGGDEYLLTDYLVLYGGMDSDEITDRLPDVNHIMTQVAMRMANEVACRATSFDFSKPQSDRLLFPYVEMSDTPLNAPGAIKDNIQHLYEHVLGESLELDHPDIELAYNLFKETQFEGAISAANNDPDSETIAIISTCRATTNPNTGAAIPAEQQVVDDPTYTVRAWMAVLTYMLSDYRFLYE